MSLGGGSPKVINTQLRMLGAHRHGAQPFVAQHRFVMEPARLTPATETRMLTRKKLVEAPFNDSQSQVAEKALRLDNIKIYELNISELVSVWYLGPGAR